MALYDEILFEYSKASMIRSQKYDEFLSHFAQAVQALGFKYYLIGYGYGRGALQKCDGFIQNNNYPQKFDEWYDTHLAANVDTALEFIMKNRGLASAWVTIDEHLIKSSQKSQIVRDSEAYKLWECSTDFGLINGITVAAKNNSQKNQSGFSLVADKNLTHVQFMNLVIFLRLQINELADIVFTCCPTHERTIERFKLTAQEYKVTMYNADGRTLENIAAVLKITHKTAKSHYKNAKRKILGRNEFTGRAPTEVSHMEYHDMLKSFGIPPKQQYIPEIRIV